MKAGKFYLVFPTAILQRLFELFFRSWLAAQGRADKQIRFKYHCKPFNRIIQTRQGLFQTEKEQRYLAITWRWDSALPAGSAPTDRPALHYFTFCWTFQG